MSSTVASAIASVRLRPLPERSKARGRPIMARSSNQRMAPERSQLSAAAILSTCLSRAAGRRTPTIGSWPVRGRPGFRRRFGIGFLLTQKVAQGRTFFGPRREQIAGGHCGGLRDRRGARELNLVRLALARSCSHTFVAQQGGGLGETSTRAGAAAFPVDPRPRLEGIAAPRGGAARAFEQVAMRSTIRVSSNVLQLTGSIRGNTGLLGFRL